MTFSARAAKRRGLKISHCFSRKLRWILFERDETVANVILMTLNIRNYKFIAFFSRISTKWKMDKSIVRPAHSNKSIVRPWADNRFITVSWADNRFTTMSWADNRIVRPAHWYEKSWEYLFAKKNQYFNRPQPIISLRWIFTYEIFYIGRNLAYISWETMTYFQPSPLRGSGWKCHCFSLKLRWILFSRDETVANVLFSQLIF